MIGNAALVGLILAAEICVLIESVRRAGFLLMPNGALGLIVLYQSVFFLTREGYVENLFLMTYWLGGLYDNFRLTELFYTGVFAAIYVSTRDFHRFDRRSATEFLTSKTFDRNIKAIAEGCAWGLGAFFIIFAVSVRWNVIWSNTTYLAMSTPDTVIVPGLQFLSFTIKMLTPAGIASACLCAFAISKRLMPLAIFFFACWLFVFIFQVGSHQRGATATAGLFAITYAILSARPNRMILGSAITACALSYPSALIGRVLPAQGISSIFSAFDMLRGIDFKVFFDLAVTNFCEGIFVFAESLNAPVSYPLNYKLLSFSPLPSAIDHFESIRPYFQIRLSESVPISGLAEVYKFGPLYCAVLLLYFFTVLRISRKIQDANPIAFLLANTFLFLAFFMLNTYPLRNGLKFMLVATVVAVIAALANSKKVKA